MDKNDIAAAVFFFAKAIDIAQTWSVSRPGQRTGEQDATLFQLYVQAIAVIKASHPNADVLGDWNNENGRRTANMMVYLAKASFRAGGPSEVLDRAINDFLKISGLPVQEHW